MWLNSINIESGYHHEFLFPSFAAILVPPLVLGNFYVVYYIFYQKEMSFLSYISYYKNSK